MVLTRSPDAAWSILLASWLAVIMADDLHRADLDGLAVSRNVGCDVLVCGRRRAAIKDPGARLLPLTAVNGKTPVTPVKDPLLPAST